MRPKYYAVRIGRQGKAIYRTWDECAANVLGFKGARFKSFLTLEEAQAFIDYIPNH